MSGEDFSHFLLSDQECVLFEKFLNSDVARLTKKEFHALHDLGLVAGAMDGKSDWFDDLPECGECRLSDKGKRFRIYRRLQKRKDQTDRVRYWIPIVISNIMAAAALIISILK